MNRPSRQILRLLAVFVFTARPALACAVCYGEPDSPMSLGLTWAVGVLAGLITLVLIGVAAFFIHIRRRTNQLAAAGGVGNLSS